MIFITIYIIGVILAWLYVAWDNDSNKNNNTAIWSLFSWIVFLVSILYIAKKRKPTLKIFKRNKK